MDNNEKWEKLISMPEENATEPTLAGKAIAEITARPEPKKNWLVRHWKKLTAIVVPAVLVVGIAIPVYRSLTKPTPVIYYDSAELSYENVSDVESFVQENGLSIKYFNTQNTSTQYGFVAETGEAVCLLQDTWLIGGFGFDEVQLNIVIASNVELDFQASYSGLENVLSVGAVSVSYESHETTDFVPRNQVYAKFSYQNTEYYLDIVTEGEAVDSITNCLGALIG